MLSAEAKQRFIELLSESQVLEAGVEFDAYGSDYTEEAPREVGLVVFPESTEDVQGIVRLANELGCSLTPRVTGSNVGGLAIPPRGGVVVDLHRMNRILEINEVDMYVLVEPGVTWDQLTDTLEKKKIPLRMGYPLSPPDTSVIANCLLDGLGNLSMRYGSMGDWIGGLEAVLPTGEVIKTGAAAASDVWFARGPLPDLTGLFVAWQGTTGIVTKMAFQLWPQPPHRQRMFILTYDRNTAFKAMRDLSRFGFCDDVGGLGWPTGKMLFDVPRPLERDPGEPEFFLYLDISGDSKKELELRLALLDEYIGRLRASGLKLEDPLNLTTLVALVPRFEKFSKFPTRLDFLIDHPGGGLSWTGTYGPMSRFEAYAEKGVEIMARHKMAPAIVSRPMKGGHFGVMRFLVTFDKADAAERAVVRKMNEELVTAGFELGFIPYKTPPWVVSQYADRFNPGFVHTMQRVRELLDPNGIMSPHCWPLPKS